MLVAPCKDCKRRKVGCHGNCETYDEYRRERLDVYDRRMIEMKNGGFNAGYRRYLKIKQKYKNGR